MLAWYDEQPDTLHRAIASLDGLADALVAADGAWDLWPNAKMTSPPEQHEAIRDAAGSIGLYLQTIPARPWTGQVEKRDMILHNAAFNSDWVMPLDADWELTGDREAARHELEHTSQDAINVSFYTPINPDIDLDMVAATSWHKHLAGNTMTEPLIFRALPDIRVEQHHWIYTGLNANRERVALWGNTGQYPQAEAHTLKAPMRIVHHCFFRDQHKIDANREYCAARTDYVRANGREP